MNMVRFPWSRSIFKENVIYTSVNFLYELGLYSSECVGRWGLGGCFLVYWLDLVSTLVYWTTGVWWVVMSGFCQSQVHIAAAAAVTLLLSQDGSEEDEADADDDAYGDADCCWC